MIKIKNASELIPSMEVQKEILVDFLTGIYCPILEDTKLGNFVFLDEVIQKFNDFKQVKIQLHPEMREFIEEIESQFGIKYGGKGLSYDDWYKNYEAYNAYVKKKYDIFKMIENFDLKSEIKGLSILGTVFIPVFALGFFSVYSGALIGKIDSYVEENCKDISDNLTAGNYTYFPNYIQDFLKYSHLDKYFKEHLEASDKTFFIKEDVSNLFHCTTIPETFVTTIMDIIKLTGTEAFYDVHCCGGRYDNLELKIEFYSNEHDKSNTIINTTSAIIADVTRGCSKCNISINDFLKLWRNIVNYTFVGSMLDEFTKAGYDTTKPNRIGIVQVKDPSEDTETV